MSNIVAIVGRPNVGKSTLFNRLLQRREAIVDSESGVTRDRHYGKSDWNGTDFYVVDTGGYMMESDDVFEQEIQKQVMLAIDEAQVILFIVDSHQGITDMDKTVHILLKKSKKPVLLVINKVDSHVQQSLIYEFYALGYPAFYPISSISGSGTGDLLDEVVKFFQENSFDDPYDHLPKISIIGRPNVGKSTLTNTLLGEDRNIVTDIAGTTRDSIQTHYKKFGHEFILVDTAGIRRKKKVHEDLEFYSVMRAIRSIEYSDVCVLMLDAQEGIQAQDMNILHLVVRNKKGLVILVNKWDLITKDSHTYLTFEKTIKEKLAPFDDVPIVFISAKDKQRIHKALESIMLVFENRKKRVKTSRLNETLLPIIEHTPPPAFRGHYIKIKYCTQLPTPTPQFAFFCNHPQQVKEPYKRFIENRLRELFDFSGVPIEVYFRKK